MLVNSIEIATNYTRSIRAIMRNYDSQEIIRSCATCIIVNDEGWLLTCKHVTEQLIKPADDINKKYQQFKAEVAGLNYASASKKRRAIAALEQKYGYYRNGPCTIQVKVSFDNIVDCFTDITIIECEYADLALIKFDGFNQVNCGSFPVFKDNSADLKQGLPLCRLGYPYPEYSDYSYNAQTDDIEWITTGNSTSPLFPMDGILTRHVAENGKIVQLEISTPGLRGQSGGPLFDRDGVVCGLQSSTLSLPLGFDQVNKEIMIDGKKKKISNYPFLHLGRCVHVDIIKQFMDEQHVSYQKG